MLSFWGDKMRTIAYVDGYNLYHGRLKHTQFKWLDLRGLLASILRIQDPSTQLVDVKLFTASIKARFARRGQQSTTAQKTYHRALIASGVQLIFGRFTLSEEWLPRFEEGRTLNRDNRVGVWVLGEKRLSRNKNWHCPAAPSRTAGAEEQDAARTRSLDSRPHSGHGAGSTPISRSRSHSKETGRQARTLVIRDDGLIPCRF